MIYIIKWIVNIVNVHFKTLSSLNYHKANAKYCLKTTKTTKRAERKPTKPTKRAERKPTKPTKRAKRKL